MNSALLCSLFVSLLVPLSLQAQKTEVSIRGEDFWINGRPTLQGCMWQGMRLEGLLPNARVVQGIFDDRNLETVRRWVYPDTGKWDAERNTREFVAAMPEWRAHGLLAVTVNLQGGSPEGYSKGHPWDTGAIAPDGSLRADHMQRLESIINKADELGMVVILGVFYFGQDQRQKDEAAVIRAVDETTRWVLDHGWHNVMIEIANECNSAKYDHPILKPERVSELIKRVQQATKEGRRLLVSVSFTGGHVPDKDVIAAADFILIHGNGVKGPDATRSFLAKVKKATSGVTKPVINNEDDHFDFEEGDNNFLASTREHVSWGYFDPGKSNYRDGYQCPPVNWGLNTDRKRGFFGLLKRLTQGQE